MIELFIIYLIGIVPAFFMVGLLDVIERNENKFVEKGKSFRWVFSSWIIVFLGIIYLTIKKIDRIKLNDLPEKTVRRIINIFKKNTTSNEKN